MLCLVITVSSIEIVAGDNNTNVENINVRVRDYIIRPEASNGTISEDNSTVLETREIEFNEPKGVGFALNDLSNGVENKSALISLEDEIETKMMRAELERAEATLKPLLDMKEPKLNRLGLAVLEEPETSSFEKEIQRAETEVPNVIIEEGEVVRPEIIIKENEQTDLPVVNMKRAERVEFDGIEFPGVETSEFAVDVKRPETVYESVEFEEVEGVKPEINIQKANLIQPDIQIQRAELKRPDFTNNLEIVENEDGETEIIELPQFGLKELKNDFPQVRRRKVGKMAVPTIERADLVQNVEEFKTKDLDAEVPVIRRRVQPDIKAPSVQQKEQPSADLPGFNSSLPDTELPDFNIKQLNRVEIQKPKAPQMEQAIKTIEAKQAPELDLITVGAQIDEIDMKKIGNRQMNAMNIPSIQKRSFELKTPQPKIRTPEIKTKAIINRKFDKMDMKAFRGANVPELNTPTIKTMKVEQVTPEITDMEFKQGEIPKLSKVDLQNAKIPSFDFTTKAMNIPGFSIPEADDTDLQTLSIPEFEQKSMNRIQLPAVRELEVPTFSLPDVSSRAPKIHTPRTDDKKLPDVQQINIQRQMPEFNVPDILDIDAHSSTQAILNNPAIYDRFVPEIHVTHMMDEKKILDNLTKKKQLATVFNVNQQGGGMHYQERHSHGLGYQLNPILYKPMGYHTHRQTLPYSYIRPMGYNYSRYPSYYSSYRTPLPYSYIGNSLG